MHLKKSSLCDVAFHSFSSLMISGGLFVFLFACSIGTETKYGEVENGGNERSHDCESGCITVIF
jgi:hypothetical protein